VCVHVHSTLHALRCIHEWAMSHLAGSRDVIRCVIISLIHIELRTKISHVTDERVPSHTEIHVGNHVTNGGVTSRHEPCRHHPCQRWATLIRHVTYEHVTSHHRMNVGSHVTCEGVTSQYGPCRYHRGNVKLHTWRSHVTYEQVTSHIE